MYGLARRAHALRCGFYLAPNHGLNSSGIYPRVRPPTGRFRFLRRAQKIPSVLPETPSDKTFRTSALRSRGDEFERRVLAERTPLAARQIPKRSWRDCKFAQV